ncbi:Homeodomain-interacting protein kinase 1 [Oryzias melastigma]|uniref:Homeodomain-interacting protein kinase 1 n=1 Tax=Oryzias melastigma TaxID=30732 RepID=A0A834BX64_ORYME|nr:Homeodomain-interacting protein kinase 1 [Oryzias melastigma]
MNSPDEYSEITREAVRRLNNIPDLEEMKNIHKKMYDLFDDDDHRAFLNLLKNMLDLDPRQRITPSQALDHDFITMRHLSDSAKDSYAAIAQTTMRQAQLPGMERTTPTADGPVDVKEVFEEELKQVISSGN